MMRERLAQLLRSKSCWNNDCPEGGCEKCDYIGINDETAEQIADYLIANGVIVLSKADVVAYKKENTITPECITQALELLKSHAVMPDFRREVAFAHLLAEEKLKGEKE